MPVNIDQPKREIVDWTERERSETYGTAGKEKEPGQMFLLNFSSFIQDGHHDSTNSCCSHTFCVITPRNYFVLHVYPMFPTPCLGSGCSICLEDASSQTLHPTLPTFPESAQASFPPGSLTPEVTCSFSTQAAKHCSLFWLFPPSPLG